MFLTAPSFHVLFIEIIQRMARPRSMTWDEHWEYLQPYVESCVERVCRVDHVDAPRPSGTVRVQYDQLQHFDVEVQPTDTVQVLLERIDAHVRDPRVQHALARLGSECQNSRQCTKAKHAEHLATRCTCQCDCVKVSSNKTAIDLRDDALCLKTLGDAGIAAGATLVYGTSFWKKIETCGPHSSGFRRVLSFRLCVCSCAWPHWSFSSHLGLKLMCPPFLCVSV